jgi:hypothetical protein
MGLSRGDLFHGDTFPLSPWLFCESSSLVEVLEALYFFSATYRLIEIKDLLM